MASDISIGYQSLIMFTVTNLFSFNETGGDPLSSKNKIVSIGLVFVLNRFVMEPTNKQKWTSFTPWNSDLFMFSRTKSKSHHIFFSQMKIEIVKYIYIYIAPAEFIL